MCVYAQVSFHFDSLGTAGSITARSHVLNQLSRRAGKTHIDAFPVLGGMLLQVLCYYSLKELV